jgi:hypothetical protein
MPVVRYRVACRSQLLKAWRALDADARARAAQPLGGIARWLDSAQDVDAGLDAEFVLPLARRYPAARGVHGLRLYAGTPWDLPAAPVPNDPESKPKP